VTTTHVEYRRRGSSTLSGNAGILISFASAAIAFSRGKKKKREREKENSKREKAPDSKGSAGTSPSRPISDLTWSGLDRSIVNWYGICSKLAGSA